MTKFWCFLVGYVCGVASISYLPHYPVTVLHHGPIECWLLGHHPQKCPIARLTRGSVGLSPLLAALHTIIINILSPTSTITKCTLLVSEIKPGIEGSCALLLFSGLTSLKPFTFSLCAKELSRA